MITIRPIDQSSARWPERSCRCKDSRVTTAFLLNKPSRLMIICKEIHHLYYIHPTMSLCLGCQEIPDDFFRPSPNPESNPLKTLKIPHLPIYDLQKSAASRCPLCKILASGSGGDLPLEIQATHPTHLRLAMIGPHQAFDVCVDMDDYNRVFYYHVPPSFSKLANSVNLPYLRLTNLCEVDIFRSLN